jgi:hypothetical protein
VLTLLGAWCVHPACAAEDPLVQAATRALAAGQAVAALHLLEGQPSAGTPHGRLTAARAHLALGRADEARRLLALADADDLASWPPALRADAAALTGEASLGLGDATTARTWLLLALAQRPHASQPDRVLLLVAEAAGRLDDGGTVLRASLRLWRDWPRSPYRARAGLLAARQQAAQDPEAARVLLAGVRADPGGDDVVRLGAAELLCHLLLPTRPGECLVVAEQELARQPAAGRLPLYRALALAVLDPAAGATALAMLPADMQQESAVVAARSRTAVLDEARHVVLRIEHARAQRDLGRVAQSRALVEPLAERHAQALILLLSLPDSDPLRWIDVPAAEDPAARAALAIALAMRDDHQRAWSLFAPLVRGDQAPVDGLPLASLYTWALRTAGQVAPGDVAALRQRLLSLPGEGEEIGLAWATEAQRREQAGDQPDQVRSAWERAGIALPAHHPWQAPAIWRACRPLLSGGELTAARGLLERVPASPPTPDRLRCRFLLAQVYERLALVPEARRLIAELQPHADAEQAGKLTRMAARLDAASSSEVQPHPLDAEN